MDKTTGLVDGEAVGCEADAASAFDSQRDRITKLVQSGLLIALLAASVQITVPIGPVPFTLQTLVVMLIALILPPGQAAFTLIGYVLLGALGAPVFSAMRGGLAVIVGPTGGYIYSFIISAAVGALLRRAICPPAKRGDYPRWRSLLADIVACIAALVICYLFGTLHFMAVAAMGGQARDVVSVLLICVVPFVAVDLIKAAAAILVASALRAAVPSISRQ